MNWKKNYRSTTRATLANLRATFKNLNFEFKDELKHAMPQFEFHCSELREFT